MPDGYAQLSEKLAAHTAAESQAPAACAVFPLVVSRIAAVAPFEGKWIISEHGNLQNNATTTHAVADDSVLNFFNLEPTDFKSLGCSYLSDYEPKEARKAVIRSTQTVNLAELQISESRPEGAIRAVSMYDGVVLL